MHKIYQVNIGGYDQRWEHILDGCEFHYVTEIDNSTGDPFIDSRIAKFNPPFPVEEGAIVLYIDGAFQITETGISAWLEEQIGDNDIIFNASFNVADCYDEGRRVLARGIGNPTIINAQLKDYETERVQGNNNHAFGGIFVFRDSVAVRRFLSQWQEEFFRYPSRDQIALHKLRQQTELKQGWMNPYTIVKFHENHGFKHQFTYHKFHNRKERPTIHTIVGWDSYKEIGKHLNKRIECVPDDEWICVMDSDVATLTPFWGKQIEDAIIRYPDTAIFSCYTNRIALKHQQLDGFSDNTDIRYHSKIAKQLALEKWDECTRVDKHVAGFMQIFPKWYWKESPYPDKLFIEDASIEVDGKMSKGALFDALFCEHAVQKGYPIRLLDGMYVFHCYRIETEGENAKYNIDHLL